MLEPFTSSNIHTLEKLQVLQPVVPKKGFNEDGTAKLKLVKDNIQVYGKYYIG